jgi:hypothetical protein
VHIRPGSHRPDDQERSVRIEVDLTSLRRAATAAADLEQRLAEVAGRLDVLTGGLAVQGARATGAWVQTWRTLREVLRGQDAVAGELAAALRSAEARCRATERSVAAAPPPD